MKGLILIRLTANLNYMFLHKCLLSLILFFTCPPEALSQRLVTPGIRRILNESNQFNQTLFLLPIGDMASLEMFTIQDLVL